MLNFTRLQKHPKSSRVYSKVYIDNLFLNGSAQGTGCQLRLQLSSCRSRRVSPATLYTHRGKNQRANYTFMGMFRDDTKLCAHA